MYNGRIFVYIVVNLLVHILCIHFTRLYYIFRKRTTLLLTMNYFLLIKKQNTITENTVGCILLLRRFKINVLPIFTSYLR